MGDYSTKSAAFWIGPLLVLLAAFALPTPASAKALASEAIASAVENGTFDQVRQEILMDMNLKQKFEFDEVGVEAVGRALLGQGRHDIAVEVLQLNQMINSESAPAANAIADAFRESGNSVAARRYYDIALKNDSGNAHARQALEEIDDGDSMAMAEMGAAGFDPAALAQMGIELSPEQEQRMQEAIAQLERMQVGGGRVAPTERGTSTSSSARTKSPAEPEAVYESEYCEILHRHNASKKISDAQTRTRVEGEYGQASDSRRLRTWNIVTTCGEFLIAVPLWADVSPPILTPKGRKTFEDSMGGTWSFQVGGDGTVSGVVQTSSDGTTTEMTRLGDPRSFK